MTLWIVLVGVYLHSLSQKPVTEQMGEVCVVNQSVKKGEILTSKMISKQLIALHSIPKNAVGNCASELLTKFPTLIDIQSGDLIQLSMFQKPEELASLKDQVSQKEQIMYLPIKDLHSFPQPLEIGQEISLLAKAKKTDDAVELIPQVKIVDILYTKNDKEGDQIFSIGLAVDAQNALLLTKAVADGSFLIAVGK